MGCTNQTCTVLFLCLFAFSLAEIKDDKGDEKEYDCRFAENLKRDRYIIIILYVWKHIFFFCTVLRKVLTSTDKLGTDVRNLALYQK